MKNEGLLREGMAKSEIEDSVKFFRKDLKPGKFDPRTNHGARLGMTESQVRRILGKPSRVMWSKKFNARELIYRREEKWKPKRGQEADGTGMSWRNYYLFRAGKLYYIELRQALEGGA